MGDLVARERGGEEGSGLLFCSISLQCSRCCCWAGVMGLPPALANNEPLLLPWLTTSPSSCLG